MSIENFLNELTNELTNQLVLNTAALEANTAAALEVTGLKPFVPNAPTSTASPVVADVQGATASQSAPAAGSVEPVKGNVLPTDINGMPWDERIHSAAMDPATNLHKKTGKGVWQKRKNIPPLDFKRIEGEIMATQAGAAAIPSTSADLVADTPAGVTEPPLPAGVQIPATSPPLVLPIPADIVSSTQQDVINITQVFAEIHGADAMAGILTKWQMTAIEQLPATMYPQFVQHMIDADAKLTSA